MKYPITITIDTDPSVLSGFTDSHLAALWVAAQTNSAPFGDVDACHAAEAVGREIIRRFVLGVGPELWIHQGRHVNSAFVMKYGKYVDGALVLDRDKLKEGE